MVKPNDVIPLNTKEQKLYDIAEQELDAWLFYHVKEYDIPYKYDARKLTRLPERVRSKLVRDYLKNGWEIITCAGEEWMSYVCTIKAIKTNV